MSRPRAEAASGERKHSGRDSARHSVAVRVSLAAAAVLLTMALGAFRGASARFARAASPGVTPTAQSAAELRGRMALACDGHVSHLTVAAVDITTNGTIPMASARGIFARHCLKVSWTRVITSVAGLTDLIDGNVDVAFSPSIPVVNFVSQGAALRVLAPSGGVPTTAETHNPSYARAQDLVGIFVAKASKLSSPLSLEGQTVAVPDVGAQIQVVTAWLIKKDGGDPRKVRWIVLDFPAALPELEAGKVAAAGLAWPYSNSLLARGGRLVAGGDVRFFGAGAANGFWTTTAKRWASEHRALSEFRASMTQANAYARTHWKQFVPYAAAVTKLPASIVGMDPWAISFPTSVSEADLLRVARNMVYAGFLSKMPDLSGVVVH